MVPAAFAGSTVDAAGGADGAGRHHHRRRQLLLPRRHRPGRRPRAQGHPLRRRRHQRRRVRPRARLLPHDRRRGRRRSPTSTRSSAPSPRARQTRAHPGSHRRSRPRRAWATCTAGRTAPATSSRWCTTASSTGSWRPTPRGSTSSRAPTSGRSSHEVDAETDPAARPAVLPVRHRHRRGRRGVAAGQRHRVVAARPHRQRPRRRPAARGFAGSRVRLGRGPLDRRWRPSTRACPRPCSPAPLFERFSSRGDADFADRVLSAMRKEFGGHVEKTAVVEGKDPDDVPTTSTATSGPEFTS